jgi:hypothetical protein
LEPVTIYVRPRQVVELTRMGSVAYCSAMIWRMDIFNDVMTCDWERSKIPRYERRSSRCNELVEVERVVRRCSYNCAVTRFEAHASRT